MNKHFIHKLSPIFLMLFISSCTSEDSIDKTINCIQKFNEITQDIQSKSGINSKNVELTISKLLPSCPQHVGIRLAMADIKISQGDNASALKYINTALEIEPNNPKTIHLKGVVLSLLGKVEMSLDMLKKSLNLEPNNIDYLVNYCSTLESFSKYKAAIKICNRASRHKDAPPVVYFIRGRSYEAIGKNKESQQDYEKARKLGFEMWPK